MLHVQGRPLETGKVKTVKAYYGKRATRLSCELTARLGQLPFVEDPSLRLELERALCEYHRDPENSGKYVK